MTRDDVIRMAREAGFERCDCEPNCHLHYGGAGSLEIFAYLAITDFLARTGPAHQEPTDQMVGSWPWLRGVISGIPTRTEPIGGQMQRYVALDEVLGWIEEGHRRSAEVQQAKPVRLTRESVARAIWSVRREHEDRCDLELGDIQDIHPVWREADAVLAIAERVQSGVAWLTTEQARNAERYAYLRSQHEGSVAASFAVFAPEQPIGEFGPVGSMPGELDAAIDAAMRADSHKVEG